MRGLIALRGSVFIFQRAINRNFAEIIIDNEVDKGFSGD